MITRRSAKLEDLDGIMKVEEIKWGKGTAAQRETMRQRILLCNSEEPHYFFLTEEAGVITGYMVMQPTHLSPEECTSWEKATDYGSMNNTFDRTGENLYIVSIGTFSPPKASAGTADNLIHRMMSIWCCHGGLLMFTSRIPGFHAAHKKTGISVDEYWQLTKADGSPLDNQLHFYYLRSGKVRPYKLLRNGFPSDHESGGHAVLFVLSNPIQGLEGIQQQLTRAAEYEGKRKAMGKKRNQVKIEQLDASVNILDGGRRNWWDFKEHKMVPMHTLYIPQRCDWGKCTFCSIPSTVSYYEKEFFNGNKVSREETIALFSKLTKHIASKEHDLHSVALFNGGSFLADNTISKRTRELLLSILLEEFSLKRIVIEARANHVTEGRIYPILQQLSPKGVSLTIRIGIETQHEFLRNKVLKKGVTDHQLRNAVAIARKHNVTIGGYTLLAPAPFSDMCRASGLDVQREQIMLWAEEEACATIDYVLGSRLHNLYMDEVYFCSTNVGPNSALETEWQNGKFAPPSLDAVYRVMRYAVPKYGARVHLLPFLGELPMSAVPSNHVSKGIQQDLSNAKGCDKEFHRVFDEYRKTMNPNVLIKPNCNCGS